MCQRLTVKDSNYHRFGIVIIILEHVQYNLVYQTLFAFKRFSINI